MGGSLDRAGRWDLGLAERIGLWSLALWVAATLGAAFAGRQAAVGVAAGGAIMLCSYVLHLALARVWMRRGPGRSARVYLWFLWLLKWPIIVGVLWAVLSTGSASPAWLCAGTAVVPAAATLFALRAAACRSRLASAQGEPT
jgi:hypothetical protein